MGVTGVERSLPDLRPGTASTTGLSPPKLIPSSDIPMKILLAGLSHHGGLMRSLLGIPAMLPVPAGVLTPDVRFCAAAALCSSRVEAERSNARWTEDALHGIRISG